MRHTIGWEDDEGELEASADYIPYDNGRGNYPPIPSYLENLEVYQVVSRERTLIDERALDPDVLDSMTDELLCSAEDAWHERQQLWREAKRVAEEARWDAERDDRLTGHRTD